MQSCSNLDFIHRHGHRNGPLMRSGASSIARWGDRSTANGSVPSSRCAATVLRTQGCPTSPCAVDAKSASSGSSTTGGTTVKRSRTMARPHGGKGEIPSPPPLQLTSASRPGVSPAAPPSVLSPAVKNAPASAGVSPPNFSTTSLGKLSVCRL